MRRTKNCNPNKTDVCSSRVAKSFNTSGFVKLVLAECSICLLTLDICASRAAGQEIDLPGGKVLATGTSGDEIGGDAAFLLSGTNNINSGKNGKIFPLQPQPVAGLLDNSDPGEPPAPDAVESEMTASDAVPEAPVTFILPGGFGRAPETIEPGKGHFNEVERSRISLNVEFGYDDNVLESSGNTTGTKGSTASSPIIGSWVANAFLGDHLLLFSRRNFLAIDWTGGGSYYLDRPGDNFLPEGTFNLVSVSKLSSRTLLTSNLSAGYFSNPELSLVNAPKGPGQGAYINTAGTVQLAYSLTRRWSLETTLLLNSQTFVERGSQDSDFIEYGLGEALRYKLTKTFSTVLDLRASQTRYNDSHSDFNTEWLLLGFDAAVDQRISTSFRVGGTLQEYRTNGWGYVAGEYVESALNYSFGKASALTWMTRYGFETQNDGQKPELTYRTGLNVNLVFSPKITTTVGFNYTYSSPEEGDEQTINGIVGANYLYSRWWSFYAKYIRSQVISGDPVNSYSKNQYFIGVGYRF